MAKKKKGNKVGLILIILALLVLAIFGIRSFSIVQGNIADGSRSNIYQSATTSSSISPYMTSSRDVSFLNYRVVIDSWTYGGYPCQEDVSVYKDGTLVHRFKQSQGEKRSDFYDEYVYMQFYSSSMSKDKSCKYIDNSFKIKLPKTDFNVKADIPDEIFLGDNKSASVTINNTYPFPITADLKVMTQLEVEFADLTFQPVTNKYTIDLKQGINTIEVPLPYSRITSNLIISGVVHVYMKTSGLSGMNCITTDNYFKSCSQVPTINFANVNFYHKARYREESYIPEICQASGKINEAECDAFLNSLLSSSEKTLEEKASIINQMNLNIEDQIALIEQLDLTIEEYGRIINELKLNLAEKVTMVQQLTVSTQEQARLIAAMKISFSDQAEIINGLENTVFEDAQLIGMLAETKQEQAEIIENLDRNNIDLQELIAELQKTNESYLSDIDELKSLKTKLAIQNTVMFVLIIGISLMLFFVLKTRKSKK